MPTIVSFDFDDTLAYPDGTAKSCMLEMVLFHAERGDECHIVTSRTESHEDEAWIALNQPSRMTVAKFITKHMLPIRSVTFTAHEPKGAALRKLGAHLHYDDDRAEVDSAADHGVVGVLVSVCKEGKS
jgi:acid phosphatase class B